MVPSLVQCGTSLIRRSTRKLLGLARKMSLKNKMDWGLFFLIFIILFIVLVCIPAAVRNGFRSRDCMAQVEKVISFWRDTDSTGKIHYYVSFIGKDGEICYDTELPPAEFYRLKAEHEPLVH